MSRQAKNIGTLTYDKCSAIFALGRQSGFGRKIAPNTHIDRSVERGQYIVYFHGKVIMRFYFDGRILLYSGGHKTLATKQRLCDLSPVHVCQSEYVWWVGEQEFYEGMNVGTPHNERESLEKAMREGDEVAKLALQDYDKEKAGV